MLKRRKTVVIMSLAVFAAMTTSAHASPKLNGTYENGQGTLKLEYLGEGSVAIRLETKHCALEDDGARTMTFGPHGIHVVDDKGTSVLVIFYERDYAVVYAELPEFKASFCKKHLDATGLFKRIRK